MEQSLGPALVGEIRAALFSCVTTGELLKLSEPLFLFCKIGVRIIPISQGCSGD